MRIAIILLSLILSGCTALPIVDVQSTNHNSRVNYLVLHFTSEDFAESLRLLTQRTANPVSVHYLIPEPGDDTYEPRRLRVYRLVDERRRAWHAGSSYWAGADALNDNSIGIEIVNKSACVDNDEDAAESTPENQTCSFFDYSEEQLELVVALINDILGRYPGIDPVDIIGHADVAPTRRVDPGPLFPWRRLYELGIGAWYDEVTKRRYQAQFEAQLPPLGEIQMALGTYGYEIEPSGENDAQTRFVVRAFQMHFRQVLVSGQIDAETAAILYALVDKYRGNSVAM